MSSHDPSSHLTSIKSAFLTSQIRLLSQALHTPSSSTTGLPDAVLDKVTVQVNKKITSHNRLHFGLESQRHVLEQVDGVYWRDVLARGTPDRKAETVVKRDVDFTEAESGSGGLSGNMLPENWEDVVLDLPPRKRRRTGNTERHDDGGEIDADRELPSHEFDEQAESANQHEHTQPDPFAQKYTTLLSKLNTQHTRRDTLRRKVSQYQKLQNLLAPFENPQRNVQPNLITRDNRELEEEVARMRVLLARVGNQTQARQHGHDVIDDHRADGDVVTNTKRLEAVLGLV